MVMAILGVIDPHIEIFFYHWDCCHQNLFLENYYHLYFVYEAVVIVIVCNSISIAIVINVIVVIIVNFNCESTRNYDSPELHFLI